MHLEIAVNNFTENRLHEFRIRVLEGDVNDTAAGRNTYGYVLTEVTNGSIHIFTATDTREDLFSSNRVHYEASQVGTAQDLRFGVHDGFTALVGRLGIIAAARPDVFAFGDNVPHKELSFRLERRLLGGVYQPGNPET